MRKAKIMLSAIAVFAVIGGAFAFKASRSLAPFYSNTLTTTIAGGPLVQACKLEIHPTLTTINQGLGTTITQYSTTTLAVPCPTRTFYKASGE